MARDKPRWDEILRGSRVVAAVRDAESLPAALESAPKIVFLLFGSPMNIREAVDSVRGSGKLPLVNVDLLQGFSRDAHTVQYLSSCGTAGVISTHQETLRAAHALGLITVLRTFVIDSAAVKTCLRALAHFQPDAIELLPAIVAPLVISRIREVHPKLRVFAGGLVNDLKQIEELVAEGVDAVSLSNSRLWVL